MWVDEFEKNILDTPPSGSECVEKRLETINSAYWGSE